MEYLILKNKFNYDIANIISEFVGEFEKSFIYNSLNEENDYLIKYNQSNNNNSFPSFFLHNLKYYNVIDRINYLNKDYKNDHYHSYLDNINDEDYDNNGYVLRPDEIYNDYNFFTYYITERNISNKESHKIIDYFFKLFENNQDQQIINFAVNIRDINNDIKRMTLLKKNQLIYTNY